MPSDYPGQLDSFTNPTDTDTLDNPSHSDLHTDANDAIEAVQGELGINPRGAFADVRARLDDVDDRMHTARVDYRATNQTITTGSDTVITFDNTDLAARNTLFSRTSGVFTCQKAGRYKITSQAAFAANSTGRRILVIRKNASSISTNREQAVPTGDHYIQTVSKVVELAVNDTVDVRVFQDSGGNLDVLGGASTSWITLERVSA